MDAVVRDAVRAIEGREWDALRALLHPYVRWTDGSGRRTHGRKNVLAHLVDTSSTAWAAHYEIRDGQIYRWVDNRRID